MPSNEGGDALAGVDAQLPRRPMRNIAGMGHLSRAACPPRPVRRSPQQLKSSDRSRFCPLSGVAAGMSERRKPCLALHGMGRAEIKRQANRGRPGGQMPERRFQDIWKEQCQAARGVRQRHGVVSALDYLIGEKLMDYAEMAVTRPEFARELRSFVAEIRKIFGAEEIRAYVEHLERMHVLEDEALSMERVLRRRPRRRRGSRPCGQRSGRAATPAPTGCASRWSSRCSGRSSRRAASASSCCEASRRCAANGHWSAPPTTCVRRDADAAGSEARGSVRPLLAAFRAQSCPIRPSPSSPPTQSGRAPRSPATVCCGNIGHMHIPFIAA